METPYKKKPTVERLKETERHNAESKRAQAVAMSKIAHKLIEDVERHRNFKNVSSLSMRMNEHNKQIGVFLEISSKALMSSTPVTNTETTMAHNLVESYKSIREDFKEVTNLKEERIEVLFPERNTYFETREQMTNVMLGFSEQIIQMSAYLMRKLP